MRERAEQILKILCVALAVLLLVQLVKVAIRMNPLAGVAIPEVPSLPADTNAPAKVAIKSPPQLGTNLPVAAMVSKTNTLAALTDTNAASQPKVKASESNAAPVPVPAELAMTNHLGTNISAAIIPDTNVVVTNLALGTNLPGVESNKVNNTNLVVAKKSGSKKSPMMPPQMGGPPGMKTASLPPDIQARVDRVTDSEILGSVVHPMPMALLGIAGNSAFLRSPSGQTGLVKEGDDLGEIKLLRIGTNRVLIEQEGQKKELMIFSGFGGESLMPKPTDISDETTKN